MPEVLEHGVTGFTCENEDEMVDAVGRIGEIDRARCRAEAERRFSPSTMAESYERVYARLVEKVADRLDLTPRQPEQAAPASHQPEEARRA